MRNNPKSLPWRMVGQWSMHSALDYKNPFTDLRLHATFTAPSGRVIGMSGFYDGVDEKGMHIWRVRFSPDEEGHWTLQTATWPRNADLEIEENFSVTSSEARGILKSTPGRAVGFHYESREPCYPLGDTLYNLFGYAHCGNDVSAFFNRRLEQGYNFLRVRVPVSYFHGPDSWNRWQTKRSWLWGGSEQMPKFDRFNLDYFRTIDHIMEIAESLGLGFEMILEAWGMEFPWNARNVFTREWEDLYVRYVIARYDAFSSVYFWTLMNEYEYYPNGQMKWSTGDDLWAIALANFVKQNGPHGHPVTVHVAQHVPPYAERFATDPDAIDTIMLQVWGRWGTKLPPAIEGWQNSLVLSEYGYERNPDLPLTFPGFEKRDARRTRMGAWHGAFYGMGVANGFENTWAPFMLLDEDQEGVRQLPIVRRFMEEVMEMADPRPADEIMDLGDQQFETDEEPMALATASMNRVAVYFPGGGYAGVALPDGKRYQACWFNPSDGVSGDPWAVESAGGQARFVAPEGRDENDRPLDWVLVLKANE